ncbi:hypothetical protein ACJ5H2_05980 [Nocardioides sp. R1-1]|uniref:hypothetical protein n=1 Tax=Nocardioides sp. R1-1 TaxID=3383502 RepID=UPI0038CF3633
MNRPSFYWWDDAVLVAQQIAAQSGVRQRVSKTANASNPWRVTPAILRAVS